MKKEIDAEVRRLRDIAQEGWIKGDAESGKLALRLTEIADSLEEIAVCEEPQPWGDSLPDDVQLEKLRSQPRLCGLPAVYSRVSGLYVRTAIVPGSGDGATPPKLLMLRVERGRNGTAATFTVDGQTKFTLCGLWFCGVINMALAAADVWARRRRKATLEAYARKRRAKAAEPLTPEEELADTVARQKEEGAL